MGLVALLPDNFGPVSIYTERWVDETSNPRSSRITSVTLRVETPLTYISAMAALRACSVVFRKLVTR